MKKKPDGRLTGAAGDVILLSGRRTGLSKPPKRGIRHETATAFKLAATFQERVSSTRKPTPIRQLGASVEKRVRHVHGAFEDAPCRTDERGALDHRRRPRSVGDQIHLDVTRRMLDAEHAARKSFRLDVAARH